jgi:hypothetical protein
MTLFVVLAIGASIAYQMGWLFLNPHFSPGHCITQVTA